MASLHPATRGLLEKTVIAARDCAEGASKEALDHLGVGRDKAFDGQMEEERELRRALREEARRLGDVANGGDYQQLPRLVAECAYEHWHRILFARFLADNNLLIHPEHKVPVSLADCENLARNSGGVDGWMVAARYAQAMLPGIFRNDDPILRVRLAPEHLKALHTLASDLPVEVFTSDDGLGWVYQFWQTKRKKEVNESGRKVGGDDISAVTQLFTEPYMVKFLLHNTLGAWWVDRHPNKPLPIEMEYLRLADDGKPAAGGFDGWPNSAREITVMDPCCGSGHFLVEAFAILTALRKAEEGFTDEQAGFAVIRDNLHGLELDPRCTQIAAFNVLLAAWKAGGYRLLQTPNIACSGLRVGGSPKEWQRLALRKPMLAPVLLQLFDWFQKAPELGSLIDPEKAQIKFGTRWDDVLDALDDALEKFRSEDDPAAAIFGEAAIGAAHAAKLLFGKYTIVSTNVPYLARGKQDSDLKDYIFANYGAAKADLATAFVERCLAFCPQGGSSTMVTPQNWLFLGSYKAHREELLKKRTWNSVARLGARAFETIGGEVVNVALVTLTNAAPQDDQKLAAIDASAGRTPGEKAGMLRSGEVSLVSQAAQLGNPDARISFVEGDSLELLGQYAGSYVGFQNGDSPRFIILFWETPLVDKIWRKFQLPTTATKYFDGYSGILRWEYGNGALMEQALVKGTAAWNRSGLTIRHMRDLKCTLYSGEFYDQSCAAIIPHDPTLLPAIWCFCSSPEYAKAVRRIDQALKVTNASLVKVPFDLEYWTQVAAEKYPNGLPKPHSDDPTQWLFKGDVATSERSLHVAMARLLGYRWPDQEPDALDEFADEDGIVCLPAVSGEPVAARRVEELIARAYGEKYTPHTIARLLAEDTHPAPDLAAWLRDSFFASHCRLFHNRPFLWHIWDGRKDGFSAIVNYHKLDNRILQKLTYRYLGSWIRDLKVADERGDPGANARLVAALDLQKRLEAILHGEPPYDIFVRWKPRHEQPLGWQPDLNDGVRLNIRPFVEAGVLRSKFTINWKKDRGTNPPGSHYGPERLNDRHFTRAEKEAARAKHNDQQDAKAASAIQAASLPMDPPAYALAGETDLFGVPRAKNLFGEVDEGEGKRSRR